MKLLQKCSLLVAISAGTVEGTPTTRGRQTIRFDQSSLSFNLPRNHRRADEATCSPNTLFEEDDDSDELTLFDSSYQPKCTCGGEQNPIEEFAISNPVPETEDMTVLQEWVDDFNEIASNFSTVEKTSCINGCSICFDDFCGFLTLSAHVVVDLGAQKNFTLSDFVAVGMLNEEQEEEFFAKEWLVHTATDEESMCLDLVNDAEICYVKTVTFQSEEGVSLTEDFEQVFTGQADASCVVTYDGDSCTSCEVELTTGCTTINCTNILEGAEMASCTSTAKEDFIGPFQAMYVLQAEAATANFTVGTCDRESSAESTDAGTRGVARRILFTSIFAIALGALFSL